MRIGRVLDASDPRVQSRPINPPRRTRQWGPEKMLLLRVNEDEGSLTSVDRATLRGMGEVPWDERPGPGGLSYAQAHGVSHDELNAPEGVTSESPILARLRKQHDDRIPTIPQEPMRPAQENLIERLLEQMSREVPAVYDMANPWYRDMKAAGRMTKVKATEMINRMKHHLGYEEKGWNRRPDWKPAEAAPVKPVEVEGLYRLDGKLYQVMRHPDSGRLYAKLITFVEGKKRPTLTKAPGMMRKLRPEHLVPTEEAQELTRKTGWCVFGHFLTNPVSIARGMGPKCWERYGN